MNNIIRPECAMDEWKRKESRKIENCEGGNSMRLPMNYKEWYVHLVDISANHFSF